MQAYLCDAGVSDCAILNKCIRNLLDFSFLLDIYIHQRVSEVEAECQPTLAYLTCYQYLKRITKFPIATRLKISVFCVLCVESNRTVMNI